MDHRGDALAALVTAVTGEDEVQRVARRVSREGSSRSESQFSALPRLRPRRKP